MCSRQIRRFRRNMITEISESKTLTKHISCKCERKIGGSKCSSNQKWNNDICRCECKNYQTCKNITVGILLHVFVRIQ